jgi:hypothetical protein
VTDEDDAPVQDAQVTGEVNGPIYSGVTLVKAEQLLTNKAGGFVIMYIGHKAM